MRDVLRRSWWVLALAALGSLGSCSSSHVGPNKGSSETHFLLRCNSSCEDGLSCVCGVCTEVCTSDAMCAGLAAGATCAKPEASACGGAEVQDACELTCEGNGDCAALSEEHRCEAGVCRAQAASGGGSEGRPGMLPAEGPACVATGTVAEIAVTNIDKVDLLFVVDNSSSMAEEQTSLRAEFPKLIATLTTGTRPDGTHFPPAKDLHLGVVSSDMGAAEVQGLQDCAGLGDDGIMLNMPNPEVNGCQASYPRFLSYTLGVNDPHQAATDFACIASLGTSGCSFEQPLEAGLKALWPSIDVDPATGDPIEPNRILFVGDSMGFGELGHGDGANAGFLRSDPEAGLSAIAVVVVTDEEDCSSADTSHFAPQEGLDPQDPLVDQPLNLRCFRNAQNLYPLERYINGLKALRPGNENLVLFTAIAGVPPDLTEPEDYAVVDWQDDASRDAFYERILNDQRMQEAVDDNAPEGEADLQPSCNTDRGRAYPPRRIVEVARGFGPTGAVHSICQEDLGPAIDGIIELIAQQLGAVCLPRALVRNAEGLAGCDVLWELPPPGAAHPSTPTSCRQPGFDFLLERESGERVDARGGAVCRVRQLAVQDGEIVPTEVDGEVLSDGWYYDDFSEDVAQSCPGNTQQRVAFTPLASPPTGVVVKLQCLTETYPVDDDRSDVATNLDQPALGDPCAMVSRNGQTLMGDQACAVRLSNGDLDTTMFCHPQTNACALECEADADCPAEWICDASAGAMAASGGRALCAAPHCSAGPESASAERVGDACLPDEVPEGGFADQEAYLASGSADCGGGVCIVYRLRGDPREGCVPERPDPNDPTSVGRECAEPDKVRDHVYCTCRCDAPDGYAECGCPDGFTCVDVLDQGSADIRGGYCVKNGTFTGGI
jgi:hypothetical protein